MTERPMCEQPSLQVLLMRLTTTLGVTLNLVKDSIIELPDTVAATATGSLVASAVLRSDVIVKVLISDEKASLPNTWALVFFFLNGKRVAPVGQAYMILWYEGSRSAWCFKGWEADVYEEWVELETFDFPSIESGAA